MRRKLIHLIALIIDESDINVTKKPILQLAKFATLHLPLICACFCIAVSAIQNFTHFDKFVILITYETIGITLIGNVFTIYYYRQTIGDILRQMDNNLYTYADQSLVKIQYPNYLQEKSLIRFIYLALLAEFSSLIFMFAPIVFEIIFFHEITNLAYPCWTPWSVDTFDWKLFTLMLQFFQGCGSLWLNYVVMITVSFSVFEFLRQFERLRIAVCSLKQRTHAVVSSRNGTGENKVIFDRIMRRNIINCIRHHQMLFK